MGRTITKVFLMLIFVGATVIASQLIVGKILIWIFGVNAFINQEAVPTAFYSALSYILATAIIVSVPLGLKKKNQATKKGSKKTEQVQENTREELGLRGLPTWTDIGLAPVAFVVSLILATIFVGIFSLFPWFNAEEAQSTGFSVFCSGIDKVIAFLVLVVVAPIFEEVIFRGWLYGKIREQFSGKTSDMIGIVVSSLLVSLLFGIIHLQLNVAVNVFALSIVLCSLREITGTIYAGILTHMLKNGVAFYLLYVVGIM